MKRWIFAFSFLFFSAIFSMFFSKAVAQTASTSPLRTHPQADSIRNERVQLEKETELKILEKLEESRLREEKARMQKIEMTNFSVVNPAPVAPLQNQTQTF
ncbi:MAG TPA: hypothetical protein VN132_11685 [Bdellovibrio sp.]|nr:hypothetical protein [Bdellovibrio sp.]